MLAIGWFSTGRDEAARQLLQVVHERIQSGDIEAAILFVFSNREPGESKESDLFLDLVKSYGIPLICFSSRRFLSTTAATIPTRDKRGLAQCRLEYDREVMRMLQGFVPDICVLAGYMLIAGEEMCHKYDMINLHPAAPGGPKSSWQEVIWNLIETGATESGVMMHLVTRELDRGPVITYCTFTIRGAPFDKYWKAVNQESIPLLKKEQGEQNELFQLIRQQELAREFPLIVSTLKAFSQGSIRINNGMVLNNDGKPVSGCDFSYKVERLVGKI